MLLAQTQHTESMMIDIQMMLLGHHVKRIPFKAIAP